jgi:hypothetical protein
MEYRTSFQCPVTGESVIARWARNSIIIVPTGEAKMPDTKNWCASHSHVRRETWEEADDYIIHVSDGQTFGFEQD